MLLARRAVHRATAGHPSSRPGCCASAPRASTRRSAITTPTPANWSAMTSTWPRQSAKSSASQSNSSKHRGTRCSPRWRPTGSTSSPTRSPSTPNARHKYDLSEPYTVGEGVIVTRANDNSIKSLADIKGKKAAENATSNWSEVARKAGAEVESVEGFAQAITLLNQGRVDVVDQRQHRGVRLPRRDRRQVGQDRRHGRREERAGIRRA